MAKSTRKVKPSPKKNKNNRLPLYIALALLIVSGFFAYRVLNQERLTFVRHSAFGIDIPEQYDIHGIDVSRYQQMINWKEIKAMEISGIQIGFAFIKATEGSRLTDRHFERNWEEAKRVDIPRGAYHFFHPHRDGKEQADHFMETVKLESGDLPPVIDIEQRNGVPVATIRKRVRDFLEEIENHYQVKPIIYTNVSFYRQVLGDEFDDYPLWVAHYLQKDRPRIERPWLFWQHSETGQVNGIRGRVDFNVFNGDSTDWKNILIR